MFELQKGGAKTNIVEHDGKGSTDIGTIRKHKIKYSLAKQIFPTHLDVTKGATEEIKSQPQIKDYLFFRAAVPFTVSSTDGYRIKSIFYELELDFDKTQGHAQIISMLPTKDMLNVGTQIKNVIVRGDLSLEIPEIAIPMIGGISFASPIKGEKQWQNEKIESISYDITIPQVVSGDNGNDYLHWKFLDNPQFHLGGKHTPMLTFGIPKEIRKSNQFKFKCKLTIEKKKMPEFVINVKF